MKEIYYAYCKCGKYCASETRRWRLREMAVEHSNECGNNVVLKVVSDTADFAYWYICPFEDTEPKQPKTLARLALEAELRQTIQNCFSR